jgi:hypothetical protein
LKFGGSSFQQKNRDAQVDGWKRTNKEIGAALFISEGR